MKPVQPVFHTQTLRVEPKRISIAEFVRLGYLQEINRLFLHPLGMALEVVVDSEGHPVSLGGVWDYRDDPKGVRYGESILASDAARERAANVAAELSRKRRTRRRLLGYAVQPIPMSDPETDTQTLRVAAPAAPSPGR